MRVTLPPEDFKPIAEPLAAYCTQHEIEPGSAHYAVLGDALLSARMHALKGRTLALEGKPSDEPATFLLNRPIDPVSLKPLRSVGRGGLIFADVAARFVSDRQRDPAFALTSQTKSLYEIAFRLFDSWANRPRLDEIDRGRASAFLDAIAKLDPRWGCRPGVKAMTFAEIAGRYGNHPMGLSALTVRRYATALRLVWAHAEQRLSFDGKNVWAGQTQRTKKHRGDVRDGQTSLYTG